MDISIYVQFPVLMDVICETSVSSFDERVFSSACLGLPRVGLRIGLPCYLYCHRGGTMVQKSYTVRWVGSCSCQKDSQSKWLSQTARRLHSAHCTGEGQSNGAVQIRMDFPVQQGIDIKCSIRDSKRGAGQC